MTLLALSSTPKPWLDHVLSSQSVHMSILDIYEDNNFFLSHYFLLLVLLCYERLPVHLAESDAPNGIKWTFSDASKKSRFVEAANHKLCLKLNSIQLF